jgi:hypothetical protein
MLSAETDIGDEASRPPERRVDPRHVRVADQCQDLRVADVGLEIPDLAATAVPARHPDGGVDVLRGEIDAESQHARM